MVRSGDVRRAFPGARTTLFTHSLISFTAIDKEFPSVDEREERSIDVVLPLLALDALVTGCNDGVGGEGAGRRTLIYEEPQGRRARASRVRRGRACRSVSCRGRPHRAREARGRGSQRETGAGETRGSGISDSRVVRGGRGPGSSPPRRWRLPKGGGTLEAGT